MTEWSLQAGAQLIEHATDIRCRAERRAGELLKEMEKAQARGSNQHKEVARCYLSYNIGRYRRHKNSVEPVAKLGALSPSHRVT